MYYALLSGEHPTLPLSELKAILEAYNIGKIIYSFEGLVVFESKGGDPRIPARIGGFIKEVGIVIDLIEADQEEVDRIYTKIPPDYRVESRRFRGYAKNIKLPRRRGINPTIRFFLTEGIVLVGQVLEVQDTKSFNERRPGKRPFFKPGPLSPQLSRALVNIARVRPGSLFLDPFCGTGGFVLEACLVGASICGCVDIQRDMIVGSKINLKFYKVYDRCFLARADAARLPLADESIEAIATDPPYGRSTTTAKRTYSKLIDLFLDEAIRVLKKNSYIVFAGPAREKPWMRALDHGFEVLERHHMYVHSGLTREVVVAVKR